MVPVLKFSPARFQWFTNHNLPFVNRRASSSSTSLWCFDVINLKLCYFKPPVLFVLTSFQALDSGGSSGQIKIAAFC